MSKRCYYEVLEVDRSADARTLKSSYRRLALKFHPDKNRDNKEAEQRFKEASEAYEVLSNDEKRALYDQFGHDGLNGMGGGGFSGAEDIFSTFGDIFEDFFGGSRSSRRSQRRKGQDLRHDLTIEFLEAYVGVEKEIKVKRHKACTTCKGSGSESGPEVCKQCQGQGQVQHRQGFFTISTTCPVCQGQGQMITDPCKDCHGQGFLPDEKKLKVKVPKGVISGVRLLLHGEGEAGTNGGPSGDLYVFVTVKSSPEYKRENENLFRQLKLEFWQLALGDEIEIKTLKGPHTLKVKPGTQPGEVFELKGHGMPHLQSSRYGSLHLTIEVKVPQKLSAKQKELVQGLAQLDQPQETNSKQKPKAKKKKKKGFFGFFF